MPSGLSSWGALFVTTEALWPIRNSGRSSSLETEMPPILKGIEFCPEKILFHIIFDVLPFMETNLQQNAELSLLNERK
jgi:hypothetical protein